jgi:rhodanese-related sulfurtransferase
MTAVITRVELQNRMASGNPPVLLEALPSRYFLEGHLPGARHMPHDDVKTLAPALVADKTSEIVVYCASQTCRNSHVAAQALRIMGYEHVLVYEGGKKDWVEAGLQLERGGVAAVAA